MKAYSNISKIIVFVLFTFVISGCSSQNKTNKDKSSGFFYESSLEQLAKIQEQGKKVKELIKKVEQGDTSAEQELNQAKAEKKSLETDLENIFKSIQDYKNLSSYAGDIIIHDPCPDPVTCPELGTIVSDAEFLKLEIFDKNGTLLAQTSENPKTIPNQENLKSYIIDVKDYKGPVSIKVEKMKNGIKSLYTLHTELY